VVVAGLVLLPATRSEAAFSVVVEPDTGIVDGQTVTVTVTDAPTSSVFVNVCDAAVVADPTTERLLDSCDANDDVHNAAQPISRVVRESFRSWSGRTVDCGVSPDDCVIAVAATGGAPPVAFAPIDVARSSPAPGVVAVAPRTGLADGQTVTVSGERIPSTYDGPVRLFPTGRWGLSICDSVVAIDLTLWNVFTRCAVLPPGVIDVTGSTFSVSTALPARPTATLGAPLDCAYGSCIVGLTRWESTGTVSGLFVPVDFASG
jgi:hypothetical protein